MNKQEIQLMLFDSLKNVQEMSGNEWTDLNESSIPLNVLPGFDSLCSVEATALIESRLEVGDLGVDSVFYSNCKPLSIAESVILIAEKLESKNE